MDSLWHNTTHFSLSTTLNSPILLAQAKGNIVHTHTNSHKKILHPFSALLVLWRLDRMDAVLSTLLFVSFWRKVTSVGCVEKRRWLGLLSIKLDGDRFSLVFFSFHSIVLLHAWLVERQRERE